MEKDWKEMLLMVWDDGLKAGLEEVAKWSSNNWDDMAVKMVDGVLRKVLGGKEE